MTPTLVLLLKAPRAGAVKTRLAAELGAPHALAIYRELVERQVRALPPAWRTEIHFDPGGSAVEAALRAWLLPVHADGLFFFAQPPGDLGARLTAAFTGAFARGAGAVLALGGDCPYLDRTCLLAAAEALATPATDAVLVPAVDGGYCLLGLRAPGAEIFSHLAWSTPAVLGQTRERLYAAGLRTTELPTLEDVDDAASWRRAVAAGVLRASP